MLALAVCFVSLVGDLRARGFVVLGWGSSLGGLLL